jgi:peptidoglycan/LPS O-acetylase OafA/YrhL
MHLARELRPSTSEASATERNDGERRSEIVLKRQHLAQLDPVRGVAILSVVVFHSTMFTLDPALKSSSNLAGVIYRTGGCGWVGVDLFFVLSGFLITRILIRSRGLPRFLTNFYARRSLRIFPLYFATLAIWTVVTQLGLSNAFGATPWLWTYTSNLLTGWRGWPAVPISVNHFWSLAVEEQFYLVWPFTVLLCARPTLLGTCGAMLVVSALARAACAVSGHPDAVGVWPFCRADALLAGGAIALLLGESDVPSPKLQSAAGRLLLMVAGPALALAFLSAGPLDTSDPWIAAFGFSATTLTMAGLLVRVLAARRSGPPSRLARALASVGKYSYAMYVFQQPVILGLARLQQALLSPSTGPATRLLLVVVVGASLSFGLAFISWQVLEKHAIALKQRFT